MIRRLQAAALFVALAVCAACSGGSVSVPLPRLDDAEPLVRQRVEEAAAAVRRDPLSPSSWGRLGEIYDVHRYAEEAVDCYERAQELDAEEWRWPYFAGLVLRESERAASQRQLARASRLKPDYAPLAFYLGLGELQSEALDDAENHSTGSMPPPPPPVRGSAESRNSPSQGWTAGSLRPGIAG